MKSFSQYYLPTPKKWRKIGDACLAVGTFVTGGGLLAFDQLKVVFEPEELKTIIAIALVLGVIGKFLSNFFSVNSPKDDTSSK